MESGSFTWIRFGFQAPRCELAVSHRGRWRGVKYASWKSQREQQAVAERDPRTNLTPNSSPSAARDFLDVLGSGQWAELFLDIFPRSSEGGG